MTNNENWVKENSEVETEEKNTGAVVLTDTEEVKDETAEETTDVVVEDVSDETSDENAEDVADEATEEETTDTADAEDGEEEESSDENLDGDDVQTEEETKERMTRREKIVLFILAFLLALLLLLLGFKLYNDFRRTGDESHNLINTEITSSETTGTNEDKDNSSYEDDSTENDGASKQKENSDNTDSKDNNNSSRPDKTTSNGAETDKNGNDGDSNDGKDNDGNSSSKPSDNNDDDNDDNSGGNGDSNNDDNSLPDYAGETKIRISKVNDNTGIITVTVGDENIVVPVQTTVFNGRVTKSGVAQGKLFGFNCGATVMLYYPQANGMGETDYYGYMNRTGDSLTILVDINGDNSKLLIKINGFKSL